MALFVFQTFCLRFCTLCFYVVLRCVLLLNGIARSLYFGKTILPPLGQGLLLRAGCKTLFLRCLNALFHLADGQCCGICIFLQFRGVYLLAVLCSL